MDSTGSHDKCARGRKTHPGRPHCRGASDSNGQTSRTCLEVSEEPCWGPGERSVLGVLPGLEMRSGQGKDRCVQGPARGHAGPSESIL